MSAFTRAGAYTYPEPAQVIIRGFAALCEEYADLQLKCRQLQSQLDLLTGKYDRGAKRFLSKERIKSRKNVLNIRISRAEPAESESDLNTRERSQETLNNRQKGILCIRKAHTAYEEMMAQKGEDGELAWADPYVSVVSQVSEGPVECRKPVVNPIQALEQDFTIPGTPSNLQCPFNAPRGRGARSRASSPYDGHLKHTPLSSQSRTLPTSARSKRPSFADPIRAELCGNDPNPVPASPPSSTPPSATGAGAVAACPIRFLDQHSPEEIATYFANHKHELPRSHALCVKRYQSNTESIRQLDAKYGNLVSMIQGLGAKHQPMLPETPKPDEDDDALDRRAGAEKVEKWAKAVSTGPMMDGEAGHDEEAVAIDEEEGQRVPHFDRPLKEVRVGESPSRPWGISVPIVDDPEAKLDEHSAADVAPAAAAAKPAGKCPFGHGAVRSQPPGVSQKARERPGVDTGGGHAGPAPALVDTPRLLNRSMGKEHPQMLFTGPVFIGYPMEQALALLSQSGWKGGT